MAKKIRTVRKSRKRRSRKTRRIETTPPGASVEEKAGVETQNNAEEQMTNDQHTGDEELREEYAYVQQDLRRIAILAILMFVLLILLNILIK